MARHFHADRHMVKKAMSPYGKQQSFADWLGILFDTQEEVIRTLYDDDVLYDELELG